MTNSSVSGEKEKKKVIRKNKQLIEAKHWLHAGRPIKRSSIIAGHKTSFSLEEPFWIALKDICRSSGQKMSKLISSLDEMRYVNGADIGLSGAVRVFVLRHYIRQLEQEAGYKTILSDVLGLSHLHDEPESSPVTQDAEEQLNRIFQKAQEKV